MGLIFTPVGFVRLGVGRGWQVMLGR